MNKDDIITDKFLKQFKTEDKLNDFMSSIYKRGIEIKGIAKISFRI